MRTRVVQAPLLSSASLCTWRKQRTCKRWVRVKLFRRDEEERRGWLDPPLRPFYTRAGKRWPPIIFAPLKVTPPFFRQLPPPILISIVSPDEWGGDTRKFTLHGVSKVSPGAVTRAFLPDPRFNCSLHDKRVASRRAVFPFRKISSSEEEGKRKKGRRRLIFFSDLFQVSCRVRPALARTEESACHRCAASRIASEWIILILIIIYYNLLYYN